MTADVKLNVDARGHGTVEVNGIDMANLVVGVELSAFAGDATKVVLHLKPVALREFHIQAESIEIRGKTIPTAVELALWHFLKAKFEPKPKQIEVTAMDSLAREFAPDR